MMYLTKVFCVPRDARRLTSDIHVGHATCVGPLATRLALTHLGILGEVLDLVHHCQGEGLVSLGFLTGLVDLVLEVLDGLSLLLKQLRLLLEDLGLGGARLEEGFQRHDSEAWGGTRTAGIGLGGLGEARLEPSLNKKGYGLHSME